MLFPIKKIAKSAVKQIPSVTINRILCIAPKERLSPTFKTAADKLFVLAV